MGRAPRFLARVADVEDTMAKSRTTRVRRTKSQRAEIVRRYEASGLEQRQFCIRSGVALSSLQRWRRQVATTPAGGFVELVPETEPIGTTRWTLEVSLPGGVSLRFQG